ncbi:hypothetical protein BPY_22750 [Bifidobacterium psychraerophilum]|uniref:Gp37-like protein n=1 Tax=Bifidobacterium psychraerophilum TaxID=218140 RepID=UPI00310CBEFB
MSQSADEYSVEIRDHALNRVGVLSTQDLTGLTVVRQATDVSTWTLDIPLSSDASGLLMQDAAGIVMTGPNMLFSGRVKQWEQVTDPDSDLGDYLSITGVGDSELLSRLLCYPDLSKAVTAQVESLLWSGNREDLLVKALSNLTRMGVGVPASQHRGSTAQLTADWQSALEACTSLAYTEFAFDIIQQDSALTAVVRQVADLSGELALDADSGSLSKLSVQRAAPTVTRCIVKTTSDSVASYRQVIPADGATLESIWGIHETLITPDDDETPAQAAQDSVSEAKTAMDAASGTVADDVILDSAQPGDWVAVKDGMDVWRKTRITSITTGFTDGVIHTCTLGDFSTSESRAMISRRQTARRLARLERQQ